MATQFCDIISDRGECTIVPADRDEHRNSHNAAIPKGIDSKLSILGSAMVECLFTRP